MSAEFQIGFFVGLLLSGISAFLWLRLRDADNAVGAANRQQRVAHQTDLTPRQVMRDAAAARSRSCLLRLAMILVGWVILFFFSRDLAMLILYLLADLAMGIASFVGNWLG